MPAWAYLSDEEIKDCARQDLQGLVADDVLQRLARREVVSLLALHNPKATSSGRRRRSADGNVDREAEVEDVFQRARNRLFAAGCDTSSPMDAAAAKPAVTEHGFGRYTSQDRNIFGRKSDILFTEETASVTALRAVGVPDSASLEALVQEGDRQGNECRPPLRTFKSEPMLPPSYCSDTAAALTSCSRGPGATVVPATVPARCSSVVPSDATVVPLDASAAGDPEDTAPLAKTEMASEDFYPKTPPSSSSIPCERAFPSMSKVNAEVAAAVALSRHAVQLEGRVPALPLETSWWTRQQPLSSLMVQSAAGAFRS